MRGSRAIPHSARGARTCRRITRHHAKTFYFASQCLPRSTRKHAYAVYGFCRWADNAVDDAADVDDAARRLEDARRALLLAYSNAPATPGILAFRETVFQRSIPKHLFDDLLNGMAMDLHIIQYEDFEALDRYCYRVAGVVGLMMTHVLGYRDAKCFPQAIALGRAMQLTNILRDIREDLERGRVYLPQDELAHFGIDSEQLTSGRVDDRFRSLMRFQIDRTRAFYDEAEQGIPFLIGSTSRLTVRVMSRLYGGILDEIEAIGYDVFQTRAHVSTARKLRLLAHCQARTWVEDHRRFWIG
ncbi:phytoene/squalene synthase family protein [soil metagenome]